MSKLLNENTTEQVLAALTEVANQIGVGPESVFPWFIQQQVLEGITFFIGEALLVVGVGISARLAIRAWKVNRDSGWGVMLALIAVSGSIIITISMLTGLQEAVGQIFNPEYAALKALSKMLPGG